MKIDEIFKRKISKVLFKTMKAKQNQSKSMKLNENQ